MPPKSAAQTLGKKKRVQPSAKKQSLQPPAKKQRLQPPTILSSGEDESEDSPCGDSEVEESFCSDDLESECSVGVGSQDGFSSDEDEPTAEENMWVHDPEVKYQVWQIDDVRYNSKGEISEVCVLWDWRLTPQSRRYRRWEPAALLMETHSEEVKLAERFKKSDVKHFHQFCKTDEFGKRIMDASDNYNCLFNGLKIGARVIGRPNLIPEDVVDKFLDDELKEGRDLLQGCTWKQFAKLLPRLRAARCDLVINCFQKNLAPGGHRGPTFIKNLVVEDGCCLVGAYNRNFYGHCVVLCVADGGQKRSIFDEDTDGNIVEKSIDEQNWIVFYAFVRPFRVFNRRG
ncbi:hypothetical protein GN244_ATG06281 [Phytophthora infestans]|uniref:Uncharacterized protein n=1 Tax=Phytophthora infestans TaxID=4787 RepID=A0A833TIH3_PHYIN|nr:hypothetical protein GN244_ATG06281 [Phytophthora infestans]KAF4150061.1 hypothetical protein GN958_ATG00687 [Phytophthora infestans]KAI9980085.1 hypothetical protein PInf_026821 [Phytophthora infestans]KAI9991651.1 hypothetical protein PInf_016997 [Phytophthora infestans]